MEKIIQLVAVLIFLLHEVSRIEAVFQGKEKKVTTFLNITPQSGTYLSGKDIPLKCKYCNAADTDDRDVIFTWEHNSTFIWESKRNWSPLPYISGAVIYTESCVDSVLRIRNAHVGSSGSYTCTVSGKNVYRQAFSQLKVHQEMLERRVRVREDVSMQCHPIISVSQDDFYIWYFNNHIMFLNHTQVARNKRISISYTGMHLNIKNITKADAGTYSCNIVQARVMSLNLTVYDLPRPTPTNTSDDGKPSGAGKLEAWSIGAAFGFILSIIQLLQIM